MRYRLEFHPNPLCMTIHVDKVMTTSSIEMFCGEKWDKDKQPPIVKELYKEVPGIDSITLKRYEVGIMQSEISLKKGVVFGWKEITKKVLPLLLKQYEPGGKLVETGKPLGKSKF
jgi:hypothetical protein